jgi:pyruvate formate lyase activating enzyme
VPWHFTAFHPDWRMKDISPTPAATLSRARSIATKNGVRYAFTGNVHDPAGQTTYCHSCGAALVGRDGYRIKAWRLTRDGACQACGAKCAGVFQPTPGTWGAKRLPVAISTEAA